MLLIGFAFLRFFTGLGATISCLEEDGKSFFSQSEVNFTPTTKITERTNKSIKKSSPIKKEGNIEVKNRVFILNR